MRVGELSGFGSSVLWNFRLALERSHIWRRSRLHSGELQGAFDKLLGRLRTDFDLIAEAMHEHGIANGQESEHREQASHDEVRCAVPAKDLERGAERFFDVQLAAAELEA